MQNFFSPLSYIALSFMTGIVLARYLPQDTARWLQYGSLALVLAAIFVHTRWVVLLVLPAILMPFIFLLDLQHWLRDFGLNLDETAALSSAIDPFVPLVLGRSAIAQFETVALPGLGLWLAIVASILCLIALYFHRKAYKPLVEAAAGGQ